jgi:hypothetical protein
MNKENIVNWRKFKVPIKVVKVNDNLVSDKFKNTKGAVNEMGKNDTEMKMR